MKKSLSFLFLLMTTQVVFSNNNAGSRNPNSLLEDLHAFTIQNSISVDLGGNYLFAATIVKMGSNSYSYIGTLSHSGTLVGSASATFQTQYVNGVEVIIDTTYVETYSNPQTSGVILPKHSTIKAVIQNIR